MKNTRIVNKRVIDRESLGAALEGNSSYSPAAKEATTEEVEEIKEEVKEEVEEVVEEVVEEIGEVKSTEDVVEEDLHTDWNSDSSEGEAISKDTDKESTLSQISKKLGVEVESIDSLVDIITENKSSKEAQDSLPDDIKKAIEMHKEGLGYNEYLEASSVDYNKVSDLDIYANSISEYFTDESGVVNEDKLQEHVENTSENDIKIQAGQIRKFLISDQDSAKQSSIERETAKKAKAKIEVDKAISTLDSIHGFKVDVVSKDNIKKSITNDTLIKEMFFDKEGSIDYNKVVEAKFKVDNFEKIVKFLEVKAKNVAKKDIIETMGNIEKRPSSTPAIGEVKTSIKSQQASWIEGLKNKH